PAVERAPDMDLQAAEALDRNAFDDPLRDIAAHDYPEHHGGGEGGEPAPVGGKPVLPRPPPEWRVDEVDSMIEHIAPFGRGAGHARELPVDGVEHHEDEP